MIVRANALVLLLSLCFVPFVSAQSWEETYEGYLFDGNIKSGEANYAVASELFNEAYLLALEHRDTLKVFESGLELIMSLYWALNYDQMTELGLELDSYYSSSVPGSTYAQVMDWFAYSYYIQGEQNASFNVLKKALSRLDSSEYPLDYAELLTDLGNRSVSLGNYQESLDYKKRALAIYDQFGSNEVYSVYLSIYISYLYLGDIDTGITFLLRACDYAEQSLNNSLLFECYYYLGDYYQRKNDFSKAIINFEKSARVAENSRYPVNKIRPNRELGILYTKLDEIETALIYFNRMYELSQAANLIEEEMRALTNLGISYHLLGEYTEAERILFEAYDYYKSSDRDLERSNVTGAIVDLYMDMDLQEKALPYIDEIYDLGVEKSIDRIQLRALHRYVRLDDSFISKEEKLSLSKDVYRFSSSYNGRTNLSGLQTLATAYVEIYPDSAIILAEQALEVIERLRLSVSNGQLKMGAFSDYASFYNEIGSWYASYNDDHSKAFELFESAKSRTLVDQLAESQTEGLNEIPEHLEIQFLQLQKKIDQLYREKETAPLNEIPGINVEIVDAELAYQVAYEKIRSENPILEAFEYPEPISLEETQRLLDSKTTILQYALIENGLGIILISKEDVVYKQVDYVGDFNRHLSSLVNDFRNSIIDLESLEIIEQKSDPLYDLLLVPVHDYLSGIENLVIVPDGPIALLPIDALIQNNEFLGKKFLVKTLPSITAYGLMESPRRDDPNTLLAVAGSGFDSGDTTTRSSVQRGYAALPFTLIEVDSLAGKFKDHRILKNQEVSEVGIKNLDLNTYKYIHFATHGDINELSPTQSGLVLSKKSEMEGLFGEDGLLNAQEIAQLNLNADMVVLSACNTANGRVISGEGLLGLQRAFLIAGASSVVSSLWSIYDRSTPIFMNAFYEHLDEAEENHFNWFDNVLSWANLYEDDLIDYKSIALHQTKLEMMEHPYYNHPVHWASFVITGK